MNLVFPWRSMVFQGKVQVLDKVIIRYTQFPGESSPATLVVDGIESGNDASESIELLSQEIATDVTAMIIQVDSYVPCESIRVSIEDSNYLGELHSIEIVTVQSTPAVAETYEANTYGA